MEELRLRRKVPHGGTTVPQAVGLACWPQSGQRRPKGPRCSEDLEYFAFVEMRRTQKTDSRLCFGMLCAFV